MSVAARVAEAYLHYRADAVFVDGGGVGGGVVDRLRQLHVPVHDIQFGAKSDSNIGFSESGLKYANKRAEMWGSVKEWLRVGCIPDEPELIAELTGPEYAFNTRDEIQLETKDSMKKRGVASPNIADALVLTFAYPVVPRMANDPPAGIVSEYDPFNLAEAAA